MKLICLNIWAGKIHDPLLNFLEKHSDIDIFCFQEVFDSETKEISKDGFYTNIYSEIQAVLKNHDGYFGSMLKGLGGFDPMYFPDYDIDFGLAIFVKKSLIVKNSGNEIVHKGNKKLENLRIDCPRGLQYVVLNNTAIFNFHGIATWPKTEDTEPRLMQSSNIRKVLDSFSCRKLICGDFNLAPDTMSMNIIERGMKNLIKDYGIKSTRSRLFDRAYGFSDYVLVSKDIRINSLNVPDVAVSDHLPIIVDFE